MTGFLKAVGRFWYDFIIGDDWKIAVAVVTGLVVVWMLVEFSPLSDTVITLTGAVLVMLLFALSLFIDTRERS
jgi:hypothetical protein